MHHSSRVGFATLLLCALGTAASAQPAAPGNLQWSLSGSTVTFAWTPASGASAYRLEAGSAHGMTDIAAVDIGVSSSYSVPNVPPGTYYVRLRAVGPAGLSAPSNEVIVAAGGTSVNCFEPPASPTGLRAVVNGTQVNVSWTPSGCTATAYIVNAGSSDGAADLAQISVASPALSANAPDGVYFVSVVAVNPYGASPPTGSIIVLVAAARPGGTVGFNTSTPAVSADSGGNAVIIGEVVNRSVAAATFVRVAAQVRDGGGNVIGTGTTFLRGQPRRLNATGVMDDSGLGPGEIGCFYIQTTVPAAAVANVSLQLQHDTFASSSPATKVDVIDFARLPDPGAATLALTVLNNGAGTTFFNVANVYVKRSDGRAVGCDFAFAPDVLAPGEVSSLTARTHAPASASSMTAWMHWQQGGDPLGALAAQTFQAMRSLVSGGQPREAIAAWEALQAQRRAFAAQGGQ